MRVALLAPLVAAVAFSVRARRQGVRTPSGRRPAPVPLFVAGFLAAAALRATGVLPDTALEWAHTAQELLLAAALFGLGSAVDLPGWPGPADGPRYWGSEPGSWWPGSRTRECC